MKMIFRTTGMLLLVLCSLTSCKKIEELLTFRFDDKADFTVPSAIGINTPYSAPTPDITTNARQSFSNNNTDINKVKDIKLEKLQLTISSPSDGNFQPVKSLNIYISAEGQPEKLLASEIDIPTDAGNVMQLDVSGDALDAYVKQAQYDLRTEVVTRKAVFYDMQIHVDMTFKVTAKL